MRRSGASEAVEVSALGGGLKADMRLEGFGWRVLLLGVTASRRGGGELRGSGGWAGKADGIRLLPFQ